MRSILNWIIGLVSVVYFVFMVLFNMGIDFGSATATIRTIFDAAPPFIIAAMALVNVIGKGILRIILFIMILICIALYCISQYTTLLNGIIG